MNEGKKCKYEISSNLIESIIINYKAKVNRVRLVRKGTHTIVGLKFTRQDIDVNLNIIDSMTTN